MPGATFRCGVQLKQFATTRLARALEVGRAALLGALVEDGASMSMRLFRKDRRKDKQQDKLPKPARELLTCAPRERVPANVVSATSLLLANLKTNPSR